MNEGNRNHLDRHDRPTGFVRRHGFVLLFVTLLCFMLLVPIVHQIREALEPGTPPILEEIIFIAVLAAAVISVSAVGPRFGYPWDSVSRQPCWVSCMFFSFRIGLRSFATCSEWLFLAT
jgi:hypothetical protein